jgi:hypothetical protein
MDSPDLTGNVIQFGAGITAANSQFLQQGADLLIQYGTQGDNGSDIYVFNRYRDAANDECIAHRQCERKVA